MQSAARTHCSRASGTAPPHCLLLVPLCPPNPLIGCASTFEIARFSASSPLPQCNSRTMSLSSDDDVTAPLCDIPSGCCSFTGPWTVTRSSLRMLRRVAAFCRPLRPVLLLVSFPRSRSPVVGVLGLC